MNHKQSIEKIHGLDWSKAHPARIIELALFFAREFSESARRCMGTYQDIPEFQSFIAGELDTDNLQYAGYDRKEDHYSFLWHFYTGRFDNDKYPNIPVAECDQTAKSDLINLLKTKIAKEKYSAFFNKLSHDEQMATLVSREIELKDIFAKILKAHDWEQLGYGYYKYFLERHIELDSADGGHEELTSRLIDLEDYEEVLDKFWLLRWRVYKTLL